MPPDLDPAVSLELEDGDVGPFTETGRDLGGAATGGR